MSLSIRPFSVKELDKKDNLRGRNANNRSSAFRNCLQRVLYYWIKHSHKLFIRQNNYLPNWVWATVEECDTPWYLAFINGGKNVNLRHFMLSFQTKIAAYTTTSANFLLGGPQNFPEFYYN